MPQDTPASEVVCLELDVSLYARRVPEFFALPKLGGLSAWHPDLGHMWKPERLPQTVR